MTTPLKKKIIEGFSKIFSDDKTNILYLLYYSALEAVLTLSVPLASSFIINSLFAHASISLVALGVIVIFILGVVIVLQIVKEYIIERFQQKIFITTAIKVGSMADNLRQKPDEDRSEINDKYMNYFFDILAVQKVFPLLVLDGAGLIMKVIVSLLLLLAFEPILFGAGAVYFFVFVFVILLFGKGSFEKAIERSNAKHESIYYLQNIQKQSGDSKEVMQNFDHHLQNYVEKRQSMFKVIVRQLSWTFFMEGVIISGFLIIGGLLVINGTLPVGEFVAAEVVVVSIVFAIRAFVKQIDYVYDMVEGIYKIDKLSHSLEGDKHE